MDNRFDLERRLQIALNEVERLKQENQSLRQTLARFQPEVGHVAISPPNPVQQVGVTDSRIRLFRQIFQGRTDVYPVRWVSKQGKSGYSPVCSNDRTSVCHKPTIKCSNCQHQRFEPVTDDVIRRHLDPKMNRTIGVYPMLHDETCWFLVADFDKQNWQSDVLTILEVCKHYQVPASLERSRSGNGGHIWVFFSEPIPASLARQLGSMLLTAAMEHRHQIGFDSYDRLFPNQDTMPKGGFGNLIALPLQGLPSQTGNSVFVDEQFEPYPDQWKYLESIRRLSLSEVQQLVETLRHEVPQLQVGFNDADDDTGEEHVRPWKKSSRFDGELRQRELLMADKPDLINIVTEKMLYIEKSELSSKWLHRLIRLASFQNPEFYKAEAMRMSTYGKPRVITCAEDFKLHVGIPRGCQEKLLDLCRDYSIPHEITDYRMLGQPIEMEFNGQLSITQETALTSLLAHDTGILAATTGFGKTVVAAALIAKRAVNTLILVHRRELMDQWRERLNVFLECEPGTIGGGKEKRTGLVDIAVVQSLNHDGSVKDWVKEYGQVIVDECHHASAYRYEQVLKTCKARFVLGLTATLQRRDGHHPIVLMQCGPVRYRVDAKDMQAERMLGLRVLRRYTNFQLRQIPQEVSHPTNVGIQEIYSMLIQDNQRNDMIFDDILTVLQQGRSPVILAERTAHVEYFQKRLAKFAKNIIVLLGGMGKKQRERVRQQLERIPDSEERVIIATGKLIGEGFDDPRLDTLFLVHPVAWKGTVQQYVGRLHRTHLNKKEVQVYDYVDSQVPVLARMYEKREKAYRSMGYEGV